MTASSHRAPGLVLAAPRSGEGKTTATLALILALRRLGLAVRCGKCGPDYVDPTLLALASGAPCLNLDTWLMGEEGVRATYARLARAADIVLVEGVMGLADGKSPGSLAGSTLDVARVLDLPVVLVVNARGLAGSLACLVDGFDRACRAHQVRLACVLATCTGSARHRTLLEEALARAGLPPLATALPRADDLVLPSRQLGLVPAGELADVAATLQGLGSLVPDEEARRLLACLGLPDTGSWNHPAAGATCDVPDRPCPAPAGPIGSAPREAPGESPNKAGEERPGAGTDSPSEGQDAGPDEDSTEIGADAGACARIRSGRGVLAVARDESFCFYYEDNFRLLEGLGWTLHFFSPLHDARLPACDALYLGGGYPEVFARGLSDNAGMCRAIARAAADGLFLYAECGGFMYLARSLRTADGEDFPLCGVVEATAVMGDRLRSLGYREVAYAAPLPFGLDCLLSPGDRRLLRGHEFHWSHMEPALPGRPLYHEQGRGGPVPGGLVTGPCSNVQAGYLHAYFPSLRFLAGQDRTAAQERHKAVPGQEASAARAPVQDPAQARSALSGTAVAGRPACLVLVSGPSSAGKTSLVTALSAVLAAHALPHVRLSLDSLLAAWHRDGTACHTLARAEEDGLFSAAGYHALVADALASRPLVLCDHVLCGRRDWENDLAARLARLVPAPTIAAIELVCAPDILAGRELRRGDRAPDPEHALEQARAQAQAGSPIGVPSDSRPDSPLFARGLCLDSGSTGTEALCRTVLGHLVHLGVLQAAVLD